jgi:hypothetical protein
MNPFRIACALLLLLVASCLRRNPSTTASPPALNGCTHIEVRYPFGGLDYFFPDTLLQSEIFSMPEREYIRSLEVWVVKDAELIRRFAQDIAQGTYLGQEQGVLPSAVGIVCYRGSDRLTSFTLDGHLMITENGGRFTYPPGLPNLAVLEPAQIRPFKARWECGLHLTKLFSRGFTRRPEGLLYPDPNHWCDALVDNLRTRYLGYAIPSGNSGPAYSDVVILGMFACPSALRPADTDKSHPQGADANLPTQTVPTWTSDYAMNSNYGSESPGDAVLLFETKPGWNQHGGPRLFNFENHTPRGGLVLLKNGTVKFIRTEEELKQLRWK